MPITLTPEQLTGDPSDWMLDSPEQYLEAFEQLDRLEEIERLEALFEWDVYDGRYSQVGVIADYISSTVDFNRNKVSGATIVLDQSHPLGPQLLHCDVATIPMVTHVEGERWSGRVDECHRVRDENGDITYEVQLISDWAFYQRILAWPSPLAPLAIQFPRNFIMVGPAITCIKTTLLLNLMRLQIPLWDLSPLLDVVSAVASVGGIGSVSQWRDMDTDAQNNPWDLGNWTKGINPAANFPVAVAGVNPFTDTSRWTAFSARMVPMDQLFDQILKDEGLNMTAVVLFPGEVGPGGMTVTRPTIVMDVVDNTGVTGPTGTFLDGLVYGVAKFLDDGFTQVVEATTRTPSNKYQVQGFFGIDAKDPWITIEDDDPQVVKSRLSSYHPVARDVIVGGRSPAWLNKGVNLLIEAAISAALALAGLSGIAPTILEGILDDVFLAFIRYRHATRAYQLGPYALPEYFAPGGEVALSLSGLQTAISSIWDTRGYRAYEVTIKDGFPYKFGRNMRIGDPMRFLVDGKYYTQYLEGATVTDSRDGRMTVDLKVGDPNANENPLAVVGRKLTNLYGIVMNNFLSAT
ncbi:putative minor tail protein [Nocardia phage NBR1]|uniref:minor tail protein n=1 Tax=Nocardia phage NBR1 TaxID=1109711 RepID=UPI00023EEDDC|nr:minor tail protein [Nocardia phage NBR1]AEV52238.1 putative minor tail protein [Nocardia phage NBR1]